MSKNASVCALLTAAVLFFSSACDRRVVLTNGLPSIVGQVMVDYGSSGVTTQAYVTVDGTRLMPVVAINSETLDLYDYSSSGEYMWNSAWQSYGLHLTSGDSCMLHVYQSDGEATTAKLVIPVVPSVVYPDTSFVLKEDQPLSVTWVATTGVDRYEIKFDIYYYYGNSNYFSLDTLIISPAGTSSYTLPATVIFPANVGSVEYGYCDIMVTAETGPNVGRECGGNIRGKGCGYFFTSSTDETWCEIGAPHSGMGTRHPRPERPTAKHLVERKKALIGSQ